MDSVWLVWEIDDEWGEDNFVPDGIWDSEEGAIRHITAERGAELDVGESAKLPYRIWSVGDTRYAVERMDVHHG